MIFSNVFEGIALDLEGFEKNLFKNICFISVAASIKVKFKISENRKSMIETCYFKGVLIKITGPLDLGVLITKSRLNVLF